MCWSGMYKIQAENDAIFHFNSIQGYAYRFFRGFEIFIWVELFEDEFQGCLLWNAFSCFSSVTVFVNSMYEMFEWETLCEILNRWYQKDFVPSYLSICCEAPDFISVLPSFSFFFIQLSSFNNYDSSSIETWINFLYSKNYSIYYFLYNYRNQISRSFCRYINTQHIIKFIL